LRKRKDAAAETVAALYRGGPEALKAARELLRADDQIQIRCSRVKKKRYAEAAERAGVTLSRWILSKLDAALS
jgi:hypothetical protein